MLSNAVLSLLTKDEQPFIFLPAGSHAQVAPGGFFTPRLVSPQAVFFAVLLLSLVSD
jgi:hypothetical protein